MDLKKGVEICGSLLSEGDAWPMLANPMDPKGFNSVIYLGPSMDHF